MNDTPMSDAIEIENLKARITLLETKDAANKYVEAMVLQRDERIKELEAMIKVCEQCHINVNDIPE